MKHLLLAVFVLIFCTPALAQMKKCTGSDGKITFSDVACKGGSSSETIRYPEGNSLDTSGLRQQAKQLADSDLERSPPVECKFDYFGPGAEKGKVLAANAKQECLRNIQAKKEGRETSLEHYNFWKDHREMSQNRLKSRRTMNCMPNGYGGQTCN